MSSRIKEPLIKLLMKRLNTTKKSFPKKDDRKKETYGHTNNIDCGTHWHCCRHVKRIGRHWWRVNHRTSIGLFFRHVATYSAGHFPWPDIVAGRYFSRTGLL